MLSADCRTEPEEEPAFTIQLQHPRGPVRGSTASLRMECFAIHRPASAWIMLARIVPALLTLLAAPCAAQAVNERVPLSPRLSIALGASEMLLPHASPSGGGIQATLSAAADVAVGRLTRAGVRYEQHTFQERRVRIVIVPGEVPGTSAGFRVDSSVTPARARTLSAVLETATVPIADVRLFLWGGPAVVRYTGDEIRGTGGEVRPYPARWGAGVSAGLGARHSLRRGVSAFADASVNVLSGVEREVDAPSYVFSAAGLRIGISVQP
jgi:hypothetical protein